MGLLGRTVTIMVVLKEIETRKWRNKEEKPLQIENIKR